MKPISLINKILFEGTTNSFLQLFRTAVIGVISLAVDLAVLYILTEGGMYYLLSAFFSFWANLVVNYILIRRYVFIECRIDRRAELAGYLLIALSSLALTEVIMYVLAEKFGIYYMTAKFLAAVSIIAWTFSARKFLLYR